MKHLQGDFSAGGRGCGPFVWGKAVKKVWAQRKGRGVAKKNKITQGGRGSRGKGQCK